MNWNSSRAFLVSCVLVLPGCVLQAQTPIAEIHVEGNVRLPAAAIVAASGLKQGVPVSRPDLDAAAQKVFDTGLFKSVNYQFQPKRTATGEEYSITLLVTEEKAGRPVILDIPGADNTALWNGLHAADALIGPAMPDGDQATAYYQRAIESELAKSGQPTQVKMQLESDLNTGKMVALFRPAMLPQLSQLRLEGNRQIATPVLMKAISGVSIGQEFSERSLRVILRENLVPLYEEKGLLAVSFPTIQVARIKPDSVTATVTIYEGAVWMLGTVDISGDDLPLEKMRQAAKFPEGKPANWKQITTGIAAVNRSLRSDGYIQSILQAERLFRKDSSTVDLRLHFTKGKLFHAGSLQVTGLSPEGRRDALALWRLREGDPMNAPYVDDYLRDVLKGAAKGSHSVKSELKIRPGTDIVDVLIALN